ncbi:hypothetical protein EBB79_07675 [Parasedimentitalea marina]|uniref:CBU-0592-like domain-containing protein n=1 Tax=Parasedimentitalea marina TaxID=2483033 RepID=A0A3T0N182_9RHOB|nr:hypothetical protein [Parasedimentitalea marina]AZV77784.1 hypothetical protein EBB79_07675 [Parasedimentitalea marina]
MNVDDIFQALVSMPTQISTGCGVLGFLFYLTNYTLVTFRVIDSQGIAFFLINICGACLILVSLVQDFNLGSMLIQVFWICLGVIAVSIRLRARRAWRTSNTQMQDRTASSTVLAETHTQI